MRNQYRTVTGSRAAGLAAAGCPQRRGWIPAASGGAPVLDPVAWTQYRRSAGALVPGGVPAGIATRGVP